MGEHLSSYSHKMLQAFSALSSGVLAWLSASTPPLSFLQAGCPSRRPTNSVKATAAVAVDVP